MTKVLLPDGKGRQEGGEDARSRNRIHLHRVRGDDVRAQALLHLIRYPHACVRLPFRIASCR